MRSVNNSEELPVPIQPDNFMLIDDEEEPLEDLGIHIIKPNLTFETSVHVQNYISCTRRSQITLSET